jgi:MoxR-like ATPase
MDTAIIDPAVSPILRIAESGANIDRVVLGKERQVKLCLACLIAGGHLLIEDAPGVGKTTLAQALSRVCGLRFKRIQFTSDLLPADIVGASIFERDTSQFRFHPGPIFAQLVLADEINRATPKTQSALLEAMEERHVTVDGTTRALPTPFFVIATQNPIHQIGTFPLPESQLDRFLMRVELGYPEPDAERDLLRGQDRRDLLAELAPTLSGSELVAAQQAARTVHVSEALLDYLQALVQFSRESPLFQAGLSPRAALALKHCAQAWALMGEHRGVLPEDIQAVLPGVVGHRLHPRSVTEEQTPAELARLLLEAVPVP